MKIVGLITEYNPFHNGHLYHIKKAKEITGADFVIAVMSGNFVQRGAPAIMPKHLRAKTALEAGVDLVVELPVCYASGSAEYFAAGAISLFEQLGCIDSVCFGSECGDYEILEEIAQITADEPDEYRTALKDALRKGMSFPRARQSALLSYLNKPEGRKKRKHFDNTSLDMILEQPNNILGIEYIKALYQRHSPTRSYTIQRIVSGYHDTNLTDTYSSASAIRRLLSYDSQSASLSPDRMLDEPAISEILTHLEGQVPPSCIHMLEDLYQSRYPVYANDFSLLLKYRLLTETAESLTDYMDISTDLANRIIRHTNDFITFDQFCGLLKTKDMTYARLSRCLLHILLGITEQDMLSFREKRECQYARILGFRKDVHQLLSYLKAHSSIPLVTKLTQTSELSQTALTMLRQDVFASNLYESVITDKFKMPFINEYQHQVLKI